MADPITAVFPPGEFLLDILNERGWSQVDFAEIIGRTPKTVSEIVTGKMAITPATARDIAAATDTNPMFWMNLETAYRMESDHAAPPSPRIIRHARLRAKYPVRDMVKRGWIENSTDPAVLEAQVLKFFGVSSIDEEPQLMPLAAKKSGVPDDVTGALRTWLFRVKQIAVTMTVPKYSQAKLREALSVLRELRASPDGIRRIPKILQDCGVRFVVVEHVPSSKIDGVCFWLGKSEPVIGMSLRLDRIDNFWFVLRHEIEHVLNGDGREVAMVDRDLSEVRPKGTVSMEELRADAAAADFCVSTAEMNDFVLRHNPIFHELHVLNFAQRMGVHPGLVVGQVQRRTGKWKLFRKHLVQVRPIISTVAMTDGYGQRITP